jgi:hypothetical protein
MLVQVEGTLISNPKENPQTLGILEWNRLI